MARFLVLTTFTSQDARLAHRAKHREHLNAQVGAGKLLMAADPFSTENVFATVEIKPVTIVAGS
jgi:uncharacterized protein YciI